MKKEIFSSYSRTKEKELIALNKSLLSNPPIQMHTHNFIELSFVTCGEAIHCINDERIHIQAGDLFLLSCSSAHTFDAPSQDFQWTNCLFMPQVFNINSDVSVLDELFYSPFFANVADFRGENVSHIHLFQSDKIFSKDIKALYNEYYNGEQGYQFICKNILANILVKICRLYMPETGESEKKNDIFTIIYNFFRLTSGFEECRLKDVAAQMHVHPNYLSKQFKKQTGMTFSEYVRNIRLETAAHNLLKSDANITTIMQFVGYNDTKYFYDIFKEKYGMTPAQYRKKYRQN